MTWLMALAIWCTLVAGTYLMLSRDILRCVLGLMLLGNGVNLLVLSTGRVGSAAPAVIELGADALPAAAANPLPQALVLTAIVIGFALACLSLVMLVGLVKQGAGDDVDVLRDAEPPETDPVKPPLSTDGPADVAAEHQAQERAA
ncbi:MAG: NADH-quinone oxidoreductase subunit K [Pseudomonadota bacterium]|nr:NADH-quinone oxidoreductase subunit K [Pseudomonadota bacterium]